jgi:DNA-binding YbaB/EbfC family protein
MFKGLSNIAGLMKQAREMQSRAAEMKARLADLRVEGSAGGGMVVVEVTGDQRITACRIEPSLVNAGDREMLEDLLLSAVNQALEKSREAAAVEAQNLVGGMDVPGLGDALKSLGIDGAGR